MKKILGIVLYLFTCLTYSQTSGNIANSLNIPTSVSNPSVLIGANPVPSGTWKVYIKDDIRWETYNINGLEAYLYLKGDVRYKPFAYTPSNVEVIAAIGYTPLAFYNETDPLVSAYIKSINSFADIKAATDLLYPLLSGSYVNPTWITSLPYSKITGAPTIPASQVNTDWNSVTGVSQLLNKPILSTVATSGSYVDLSNKPAIPTDNNQLTNGSGYITATSTNILTNKSGNISQWTNNSGYLTSITSGQVTTALGFTPAIDTRTLTINGVSQDLTANRTWSVGDILSTGSYSNPSWITSLAYSKLTGTPTIPTNTSQISESGNLYYTDARSRASISLTTTGSGAATYSNSTGVLNIPTPTITVDYTNTAVVAGGAGNAVFYLTSDKTSTGIALYTNITYVNPIVNDSSLNYSYGWNYNAGTKALTVNTKAAVGLNIALLSLTLLGVPSSVANGTNVQVLVKGN